MKIHPFTDRKKIVIAGGTGFIGSALSMHLSRAGYTVHILTRKPAAGSETAVLHRWDGRHTGDWVGALDGSAVLINLTGRSIDCRFTARNRHEILHSRLDSVEILGQAVSLCGAPPPVWIQASSVGYYGDRRDEMCTESSLPGKGFLPYVCMQWESLFNAQTALIPRKIILRFGIVLGREGGVLKRLSGLTRWFLGGSTGSGRQMISWIHISDLINLIQWLIESDSMTGVFNAVSPSPVSNRDFMRMLRKLMRRPWSPSIPGLFVRFGAMLLNTSAELALTGCHAVPEKLSDTPYNFCFAQMETALKDLLVSDASC